MKTHKTIDDVLLAIRGTKVIHHDTGYDAFIVERGRRYTPRRVELLDGAPNECHRNSAAFYLLDYPVFEIVTGYALTEDIWRRHSWLMPRFRKRKTIVETTVPGDMYFGVRLDDDDTTRFVLQAIAQCLPGLQPGNSRSG
jgi:hypothetical protein